MSRFGEEIIDLLHENCSLRKSDNQVRKIIDNSVGEWFDSFDNQNFFEMFFLTESTGAYLDQWGKIYNIKRKLDENDDDYRQRIILESLGHLTVDYLIDVYGLTLYSYIPSFNVSDNDLTSDNPYLGHNGFMVVASDEIQRILSKKFVIGSELVYIVDGEVV